MAQKIYAHPQNISTSPSSYGTFVFLSFNIRVAWSDEMFGFVSTDTYPLLCSIVQFENFIFNFHKFNS